MSSESFLNESSLTPEQDKTIGILVSSGFENQLSEMCGELNIRNFEEFSNIPVSPELIKCVETKCVLQDRVKSTLDILRESMSDTDTGVEIPFGLIGSVSGNTVNINRYTNLFANFEELELATVTVSPEKLGTAVQEAKKVENGVVVLGHTHPNPQGLVSTITEQLSPETKSKYLIRMPGLNLSVQDIYQLVSFQETVGSDIRVLLAVLMYSGELVIVGIDDGKLYRVDTI